MKIGNYEAMLTDSQMAARARLLEAKRSARRTARAWKRRIALFDALALNTMPPLAFIGDAGQVEAWALARGVRRWRRNDLDRPPKLLIFHRGGDVRRPAANVPLKLRSQEARLLSDATALPHLLIEQHPPILILLACTGHVPGVGMSWAHALDAAPAGLAFGLIGHSGAGIGAEIVAEIDQFAALTTEATRLLLCHAHTPDVQKAVGTFRARGYDAVALNHIGSFVLLQRAPRKAEVGT